MQLLILSAICLAFVWRFGKYFIDKVRRALPQDLDELFSSMDRFNTRDYKKIRLLHKDVVFVNNPQLIHKVLASDVCLEKPQLIFKLFSMDHGLFSSKYSQWRHDRRYFNQSFNTGMVHFFIPTFCSIADKTVKKISAGTVDGEEFDMMHYTERCTIEMIFASSFDVFTEDCKDGDATVDEMARCVKIVSNIFSERFRYFPWFFNFIFKLSSFYRRDQAIRESLMETLQEILAKKSENPKSERDKSYSKNIFINRLLNLKDKITREQFKHHIYTIAGAGYETTGTASAHCILFLALHPEVQEKAYQEIMRVFPSDDTPITHQTLSQLEYVDRVIKESLRLAPTIHSTTREALADFELTPGDIVEKGSIFVINIFGFHRRSDLWGDNANDFDPDRFLPENFSHMQQCYIAFSAGKRNCIGYRYALFSFKIILLKLLRSFKFSSTLKYDEIKFNRQIALKLVGEHSVSVERRLRD